MTTTLATHESSEVTVVDAGRLDEHPAAVYLAGLSKGSQRTMRQALDHIAEIMTRDPSITALHIRWEDLRFKHTWAIRAALVYDYSYSTANKMLSALRGTLKAAWQLGLMTAEDYHLAASVKNVKGETVPAGRHISTGEIVALLNSCGQDLIGIRDAAIISMMYACGFRRAELVAMDMEDYTILGDELGSMLVKGKGSKQRLLPVTNGAFLALQDWLEVRGDAPGAMFLGVGNRNRGNRMTTQAIYFMLQARAKLAGIPKLSPHDFRRTFVGDLLEAGADISTVQKLAGHASVTTTARYDRRDERAKQRAAELLHVPYQRRTLSTRGKDGS